MSIRDSAFTGTSQGVEVDRLEWLTLLRKVPLQDQADVNQWVAELVSGSEKTGVDRVIVNRWQAKAVCDLAEPEMKQAPKEEPVT